MAPSGEYDMGEEDRLPWLETADDEYNEGPSALRTGLFVMLGLAAIALLVFVAYAILNRDAPTGSGELISAQPGDYKVKPDSPGGMQVEGEGDTALATSEGKGSGSGTIDLQKTPETPVVGKLAQPNDKAAPGAGNIPASAAKLTAPAPGVALAKVAGAASGGSLVQLGAFPTEAAAKAAWVAASARFAYLAPLGKSVQGANVNGHMVYRLRVNAGSAGQAAELCGKLKVAGEACFVSAN
ncbi:MAG: SPOR domain-containing protein [Sphingomonas sp.]|jgi:hypothetical protein